MYHVLSGSKLEMCKHQFINSILLRSLVLAMQDKIIVCIPMPRFNVRAYAHALPQMHFRIPKTLDQPKCCGFEGSAAQLRPECIFQCGGRSIHIQPSNSAALNHSIYSLRFFCHSNFMFAC
jgi:hypothetical protein